MGHATSTSDGAGASARASGAGAGAGTPGNTSRRNSVMLLTSRQNDGDATTTTPSPMSLHRQPSLHFHADRHDRVLATPQRQTVGVFETVAAHAIDHPSVSFLLEFAMRVCEDMDPRWLTKHLRSVIVPLLQVATLPPKYSVYNAGETGTSMYVVQSGELEARTADGALIHTYEAGAAFGDDSLLFDFPREHTVTATEACRVWRVTRAAFHAIQKAANAPRVTATAMRLFDVLPEVEVLPRDMKEKLMLRVCMEDFSHGDVLYREGKCTSKITVVEAGKVHVHFDPLLLLLPADELLRTLGVHVDLTACRPRVADGTPPSWEEILAAPLTPAMAARREAAEEEDAAEAGGQSPSSARKPGRPPQEDGDGDGHTDDEGDGGSVERGSGGSTTNWRGAAMAAGGSTGAGIDASASGRAGRVLTSSQSEKAPRGGGGGLRPRPPATLAHSKSKSATPSRAPSPPSAATSHDDLSASGTIKTRPVKPSVLVGSDGKLHERNARSLSPARLPPVDAADAAQARDVQAAAAMLLDADDVDDDDGGGEDEKYDGGHDNSTGRGASRSTGSLTSRSATSMSMSASGKGDGSGHTRMARQPSIGQLQRQPSNQLFKRQSSGQLHPTSSSATASAAAQRGVPMLSLQRGRGGLMERLVNNYNDSHGHGHGGGGGGHRSGHTTESEGDDDDDDVATGGAHGGSKRAPKLYFDTPMLVKEDGGSTIYLRMGRGSVMGMHVLPSLLHYSDAPAWKDEVEAGTPNVGCVSAITAEAASDVHVSFFTSCNFEKVFSDGSGSFGLFENTAMVAFYNALAVDADSERAGAGMARKTPSKYLAKASFDAQTTPGLLAAARAAASQAAGAYDAHAFDDLHEAHRGAGAAGCILLARFRPSRGAAAAVAAAAALAASSSDGGGGMDADGHQRVALKVASKALLEDTGEVVYAINEAALLRSEAGRHPFIATLCGTFQTPDALVTVFQPSPWLGGDLYSAVYDRDSPFAAALPRERRYRSGSDQLTFRVVQYYLGAAILALSHLHKHDVAYRNLRLETMRLDDKGVLKLTDFTLAKVLPYADESGALWNKTFTVCGVVDYLAPETVMVRGSTCFVDAWALGICACELLTGEAPFTRAGEEQQWLAGRRRAARAPDYDSKVMAAIARTRVTGLRLPAALEEELASVCGGLDLVRGLLSPNPNTRWTVPLSLSRGQQQAMSAAAAPPPPSSARANAPSSAWSSQMLMRCQFFAKFDWMGLRSGFIPPPVVPGVRGGVFTPAGADECYLLHGPPRSAAAGAVVAASSAAAVGDVDDDEAEAGASLAGAPQQARRATISKSHFLQSTTASRLAQTEAKKTGVRPSPNTAALSDLAKGEEGEGGDKPTHHRLKFLGDQALFHDF